jgi:ribosomal protein L7/L12
MFTGPKPLNPEIVAQAERLALAGGGGEAILTFLRLNGFDKINSIRAARDLFSLSFNDAKQLVDQSETWSDRYQRDAEFHEMADRAVRDIAASGDRDLPKFKS